LNAIAITDHDTTGGIVEAQQAAQGSPVLVPGIELSAEEDGVDVHMLGYYIHLDHAAFQKELAHFRDDRLNRGQKIVERLGALGLPIAWEKVLKLADGGSVGRPHIARAMMEAGYVSSIKEAFDRYLHTGGPAYVARERLSPEAAIALIHRAGGAAVMAHPGLVQNYAAMIERLVPAALDGVEIMHPKNAQTVRENLRGLAQIYSLIVTGGSDFHRREDPIGSENPPPAALRDLRERAGQYQRITGDGSKEMA
jgi:3',5'-nucleoside bisphosphate phosphatase